MDVTVILLALIIGFTAITVFSLAALVSVKRRQKEDAAKRDEKTIADIDKALNIALAEINKMGVLIKTDVEDKYNSVLFLYNLVEDKKKEIDETADGQAISQMMRQYVEEHSDEIKKIAAPTPVPVVVTLPSTLPMETKNATQDEGLQNLLQPKKPPVFKNPRHKQIWEMRNSGKTIAQIAKDLSMGQGEVKLILDLGEQ